MATQAPPRRMRPATASARGAANTPTPSTPKKTIEAKGRGFVSTSVKDRESTYHESHREVDVLNEMFTPEDPPASVMVGGGLTINLGNFESLRIDCQVTLPCRRDRLKEVYEIASEFVMARIDEEQIAWSGQADKQKMNSGKGR